MAYFHYIRYAGLRDYSINTLIPHYLKSDLKKLDKPVAREIYDIHVQNILKQPFAHEKLHGDLEGVISYHFKKNRVEYRIAYAIEEPEKVVYFLLISKGEGFYELLKRRFSLGCRWIFPESVIFFGSLTSSRSL